MLNDNLRARIAAAKDVTRAALMTCPTCGKRPREPRARGRGSRPLCCACRRRLARAARRGVVRSVAIEPVTE